MVSDPQGLTPIAMFHVKQIRHFRMSDERVCRAFVESMQQVTLGVAKETVWQIPMALETRVHAING